MKKQMRRKGRKVIVSGTKTYQLVNRGGIRL